MLEMPLLEAFNHIYLLKEKDKMDMKNNEMEMFLKYQMLVHSHPLQTDDQKVQKQREDFVDMITPTFLKQQQKKSNASGYGWDEETERKIREIEEKRKKEKEDKMSAE